MKLATDAPGCDSVVDHHLVVRKIPDAEPIWKIAVEEKNPRSRLRRRARRHPDRARMVAMAPLVLSVWLLRASDALPHPSRERTSDASKSPGRVRAGDSSGVTPNWCEGTRIKGPRRKPSPIEHSSPKLSERSDHSSGSRPESAGCSGQVRQVLLVCGAMSHPHEDSEREFRELLRRHEGEQSCIWEASARAVR